MIVLFTSILKTIILLKRFNSRQLRINNNEVDRFSIDNSKEIAKKLIKLKSQKSTKLGKKLLKNRNLPKFYTKKAKSSFLIFHAKIAFN